MLVNIRLKNTNTQFGFVAIFFHWIMAILIIYLLVLGLYMVRQPIGLAKLKNYGLHKEWGTLVLLLVILRIVWRLINKTPVLLLTSFENFAARFMHLLFYIFMVAMPLTGWLVTSAAGLPISFFGWFIIPTLSSPAPAKLLLFERIHEWLGYCLIIMIILHSSAALKHHFINKDDILRRMIS